MNRFYSFSFLILLSVLLVNTVSAQDQQSGENSLLPEIDPQDIEIRSQFKARFPGLSRQPILGFDPTPRVYQIDPNRTPFMETPEQVVADLPVTDLTRPAPPGYTPMHYSSEINAFSRIGIGSYVSPEAQFWGVSRINSKSYVGGDFDYSSSDGHLDNQMSSFRFFNANGEYATKLNEDSRLGVFGGFENSFNQMPDYDAGLSDGARKEYSGFNLGAEFEHFSNTVTGWKLQANMRYFDATLDNAGPAFTGLSEELVYNASVTRRWAGKNVNETFTIKAGAKGGSYDNTQTSASESWLTAQGGVVYERLFNYSTRVNIDASLYYAQSVEDKIYIGPSVTVEHSVMDNLTVTARANAEPYLKTVEQLHSSNRFLSLNNQLQHSYRFDGTVEASLNYDNLGSLKLGVRYENISDYPLFIRGDNGRTDNTGNPLYDFYEVSYTDANKLRAYASVTHQLIADKFWLNGKVYVQSPKLQGGDRLPYEERIGVNSGVHLQLFDRISIEGWADYVGSRRTFQTDEKLGGFLLLGSQLDVQLTERVGAYVKMVNMLNQEYEVWQGYTERPFQAYGGVTVKL